MTRFFPLTENLSTTYVLTCNEVQVVLTDKNVHVNYNSFRKNQFICHSNDEWTSINYCPDHITQNDLDCISDSLESIWNNQIQKSILLLTKKERLEKEISRLEKELKECTQ